MANKKQQKRRQDRRKTGAPKAPSSSGPSQAPSAKDEPAGNASRPEAKNTGGANAERREQKEAVRRQKEKQLRRIQRTDTLRKVGVAALVLLVLAGGIWYISSGSNKRTAEIDEQLKAYARSKTDAGCSDIKTIPAYDPETQDTQHTSEDPRDSAATPPPPLDTYRSVPPVSGPHDAVPEPAGIKDTPPYLWGTIHSLEHGGAIIWYRPGTQSSPEFADIQDFVERNSDHTILAPYDYEDEGANGTLPDGVNMALASWHHLQTCEDLSLPAVVNFLSSYRSPTLPGGDYIGDAPEVGAQM